MEQERVGEIPLGDWYPYFSQITDWLIFILLTLIEGFIFFKLRFKLDTSGLLTLFLHFAVSLIRIINLFLSFNSSIQIFLNLLGTYLIWFSFYYFTIEMELTRSLLSDQPKAYLLKKKSYAYLRFLSGIFMIAYSIMFTVILTAVQQYREYYENNKFEYNAALLTIKHLKFMLDLYFEFSFARTMIYFVRMKNIKREEHFLKNRRSK